jgi:hypothetical protein
VGPVDGGSLTRMRPVAIHLSVFEPKNKARGGEGGKVSEKILHRLQPAKSMFLLMVPFLESEFPGKLQSSVIL